MKAWPLRLADPLWLLGRQWQMGELTGEDAASPVTARITSSSFAIDSIEMLVGSSPFSAATVAAEAQVEHDGGALTGAPAPRAASASWRGSSKAAHRVSPGVRCRNIRSIRRPPTAMDLGGLEGRGR